MKTMAANHDIVPDEEEYAESEEIPYNQNMIIGNGAVGYVDEVSCKSGPNRGRIFARKIIILNEDREAQVREIRSEVRILRQLQHDHVVNLVTTYLFRNNYAIIIHPRASSSLEYQLQVADNSLDESRDEAREQISHWFRCLLSVLAYTHAQDMRHRDVKPLNILCSGGDVFLTDFGISTMGLGKTVPTTMVNQPRERTQEYCAPEVEQGHTRGRSADIFSLGAVFLEMLTVCSCDDELQNLRDKLLVQGRQSYALKLDEATAWLDELKDVPGRPRWHANIVSLCRSMLQMDRDRRPSASDLCAWWSHQPATDLPPALCSCSPLADQPELYLGGNINDRLQRAYENGHRLMVKLLTGQGASMSDTAVFVAACRGGLRDTVEGRLARGMDASTPGALTMASRGGFHEIVELLLGRGASPETPDDGGRTPLSQAAGGGHLATVQLLVGQGASVDAMDACQMTPILWAARISHEAIVKFLLDRGAQIRTTEAELLGISLLWAAERGREAVVRQLLESNAPVEVRNQAGQTPLALASQEGHDGVVRVLLRRGAGVEMTDSLRRAALSTAARSGRDTTVSLLLQKGAVIEQRDIFLKTPLMCAAENGYTDTVKLLLSWKADFRAEDRFKKTAEALAVARRHRGTVKVLRAHRTQRQ